MQKEAKITSKGIKKVLKNYNPASSFAEYVWNGFDAKATKIEINYDSNELGKIDFIQVKDNGTGIDLDNMGFKFDNFYDSEKSIQIQSPKHSSILHGKNGVGRLTFFTFSNDAKWTTFYENKGIKGGTISISAENLKVYDKSLINSDSKFTGTTVYFTNLLIGIDYAEQELTAYLKKEFCWFLELNKEYSIIINGIPLDYSDLVADRDFFELENSNSVFKIKYVQWTESLNKEHSKFYFQDSNGKEIYKNFTTLNKKGDYYYHSIYIESDFFSHFDFSKNEESNQVSLFAKAKSSTEYKYLINKLNEYLKSKRKPYLRQYAERLVLDYELEGIIPNYNNSWEQIRSKELKDTIIGLYEVQPKIFSNLNLEQKKIFVQFIDLLLDSNERENIFKIIEGVTKLEPEEREDLSNILHKTSLSRVINTIKLIEDRYKTYYQLKELVFNEELGAKEIPHLQDLIENHYWLFGEEYHLVTAAEPKFEEALKRYIYKTTGEITDTKIDHINKNREMDIFACRQHQKDSKIENIVLELKHPKIKLGEKEYSQVMKYLSVIRSRQEFNAPNMSWKFYLIGNKFNTSQYIEMQIKTNKNHGEESLVYNEDGRIKVYVKTWSQICTEFELRHNFLDKKLKLEREKLYELSKNADEIVEKSKNNSAVSQKEVEIPK
ncbi:ATP-binding protein [Cellulophaga lytica]|nr:ATP-binding protein [Cellulophaga lytica]